MRPGSSFAFSAVAAVAAALVLSFAAPLAAQTPITAYSDDFQSYGTQSNPPGWVDTSIGASAPEAAGLYKTWPDPTQGNSGPNVVYGTKQSSGQPEGNNPRVGTFSTYTAKSFAGAGRFEYSGRFLRTSADTRVGITFFSSYPQADRYYLIGLWSHPQQTTKLTMQLFGFGGPAPQQTTVSDFTPEVGKWYRFRVRVDDVEGKTVIRGRFWLDTNAEPQTWHIDAVDASAGRLTSGRIGIWSAVRGDAYVDDISAQSPVDHAPPTISFFVGDTPLTDGMKFHTAVTPRIVVTDDLSEVRWTAQLDGGNFVTPVTGQGDHILRVDAKDAVGNTASKSVTFYIDTIPPRLTIVKPADGSITSSDVNISLHVDDASLPATFAATLDGATWDVTRPVSAEGQHQLTVTAFDAVGLASAPQTATFIIDKTAPAYELFANAKAFPADGYVFGEDVTITIVPKDLTLDKVSLLLDGAPYTAGTPVTDERKHTLGGTVTDKVGHVTTIAERTFWIDKTAPTVELLGNGTAIKQYYDIASLVAELKISDVTATRVTATLNGAPANLPVTLTGEATYVVAGSVTDAANHVTPFGPTTFAIDRSAPQITLSANGAAFPASGHIFLGDVALAVDVKDLTLADYSVTHDGAAVELPLTLTDEFRDHVIKVVATDKLNHSASVGPLTFTIDKFAPVVAVTNNGAELTDGRYFNRPVRPVINVTDITATTVTATLNGQRFESGSEITADGAYTLAGNVADGAGRSTPIGPIAFTIDTTAPTGVFVEGDNKPFPDGKTLNVEAIRASVKITDANPLPAKILLDGAEYAEGTPITLEDAHTLTATLVDKAGNSGSVPPVSFRIDRTRPVLTLFANGDVFPAKAFDTRFDVAVTYKVEDKSAVTIAATLDGANVTLPVTISDERVHTLVATATDAAGNVGTAGPFTFTIEKTPPNVEVLLNDAPAGLNAVFKVDVRVKLQISAGLTSRSASILLNGQSYVEGTAITAPGVYVVTGTVTTASGVTVPIPETTFTIDKTAPDVTLKNRDRDFEANGFHYNADVVPNVTCHDDLTRCTTELKVDGNDWKNGDPITAEGEHAVVAAATDTAGNRKELPAVTFVLDKTSPAITITAPAEGQTVSAPRVVVSGTSDDAVSIDVNGTLATIDAAAKTFTTTPVALLEGENEIVVVALDQAGNASTRTVHVVADTRAPLLAVQSPAPNACLNAQQLVVRGSVSDPWIQTVKVTVDADVVANALDAQKQTFTATFANIAEGPHRISVEATDTLGHRTVAALQVMIDRTAPLIDIFEGAAPFTARLVNHPVALSIRARDGDPNVAVAARLGATPYVSGTPIAAPGAYHLDVLAEDCAGNQSTQPLDFEIDLLAPAFDTLVPPNGATVGALPQSITGHVSRDAVRVEIEGTAIAAAPSADGNFVLALGSIAREGANQFVLRATDAAGNVAQVPYAFTVHSAAPTIQIYESGKPLSDGALFNRPVTPEVRVSDPTAQVTVLIGGQTWDQKPLTADGTYTISVTVRDELQRTAEASRTFTIDRTPPVVKITKPLAGTVSSDVVTIEGTAGDAVSVDVHGAIVAPGAGGAFRREGVRLEVGQNDLVVSATDRAGNTAADSVLVTWLGSGPAIVITSPRDASLTNRPRIDVTGHVLGALGGGEVVVGSKTATLDATGVFRVTDYQLAGGENVITARVPNGASASVTITADFKAPALSVLASGQPLANDAHFPGEVSISVNASDDRNLALTRVTIDGAEPPSLPAKVSSTGGHVLNARARDEAGNETVVERTFFIGSGGGGSGCSIEEVDPADGATVAPSANATTASVRITGRASGATAVTINGAAADVADGTFAKTVELPSEGANAIGIRCTDASGALSEPKNLVYYRVSGNPSVRITAPAEGGTTGDKSVVVTGEVGADVVSIDVNGIAGTIRDGSPRTFRVENVTLTDGTNILVAHGRNNAYRVGTHSVRVLSLQTAPQIRITSPEANSVAGGGKTTVGGTYSNLLPQTLAIAGGTNAPAADVVALSDTTGTFVFRGVGLAAGARTLTITGRNAAGVAATASLVVNSDPAAASIEIAAPSDNAYVPASEPVTVTGAYAGASGTARVEINGVAATVDPTASTYAGSAQHTGAPLTPVVARLIDANGSGPAASIMVRKLAGPLRVRSTFPADGAEGVDPGVLLLIDFSAPLDRATLSAIQLRSGSTPVDGTLRVDDSVVIFTPSTLLAPGTSYTVTIPATLKDVAGNAIDKASSFSFTTTVSAPSTPPQLDPIAITGCPATVSITGSAPPFARLRLEVGTIALSGQADASGRFTMAFPLSGRSGYQSGHLTIVGSDGSRSPEAPVSFRMDCAAPSVVGASYDRNANVLTIAFSKPVAAPTLVVGSSIVLTTSDNNSIGGTVALSGAIATVTPASDLRDKSFTLEVQTSVTDTAGNHLGSPFPQTFSLDGGDAPLPGDGSGFITGEVYDATSGRPLRGATVSVEVPRSAFARVPSVTSHAHLTTSGDVEMSKETDPRGRYTLPLPEGAHTIKAGSPQHTTVWRQIVVPAGAGVVPIDIRLTRRGERKSAATLPLTLQDGGGALTVTAPVKLTVTGGVASQAQVALTSVGAQSLAGLLPLGFSPIASAEVAVFGADGAASFDAQVNGELEFTLPSAAISAAHQTLSLVRYDSERDEWRTLIAVMAPAAGDAWRAPITSAGAYGVVYRDQASTLRQPPAPAAGATLQPATETCATSATPCVLVRKEFDIEPPVVPPSGRAVAKLQIAGEDAATFPSGTAVQAYVNEVLTLSSGDTVVDPPFTTDVLLYRTLDGKVGIGEFLIEPSEQARREVLETGVDQVKILQYPGRLDRGSLIGSEGGRVPGDSVTNVEIPAGATSEQLRATVATLKPENLGVAIAGFDVVGGFDLTLTRVATPPQTDADGDGVPDPAPALQLSRAARATINVDTAKLASPDAQLILVEVVNQSAWGAFYRLAVPMTRLDTPANGVTLVRYTSQSVNPASLAVDGIVREGRFLLLAAKAPIAFASGALRSTATGPYLPDMRVNSVMAGGAAYGVSDVTRASGVFALPIAAAPAPSFSITPRHARFGVGTAFTAAAPAAGETVAIGDWLFVVQPLRLTNVTPADGEIVPVAPITIKADFDLPIDTLSLQNAITVATTDGAIPLGGRIERDAADDHRVVFTSTGTVSASTTYRVTIQPTVRATNGAVLGQVHTFLVRTEGLPRTGEIHPERIRITLPDAQGHSRIFGDAKAIPAGFQVVAQRPDKGFRSVYDATAGANGDFSFVVGDRNDSDRLDLGDVVEVQILNLAFNVVATVQLTPFVTEDGKGFVAAANRDTTFVSTQGVAVTVAAGTFDKATLVTTDLNDSKAAFAAVPNFDQELHWVKTLDLHFDGTAKQRIEVSIPRPANLPLDGHDYLIGLLGQSSRGPRIAIEALLHPEGDKLTTALPPESSGANLQTKAAAMSGSGAAAAQFCMPGVFGAGSNAIFEMGNIGAEAVGWGFIAPIQQYMEVFNDMFQATYLPSLAYQTAKCRAIPVVKGKPFHLIGVDPDTGSQIFNTPYSAIDDINSIVAIDNPFPDTTGPFPIFGAPFRVERLEAPAPADNDGNGSIDPGEFKGRGFVVTRTESGTLTVTNDSNAAAQDVLPENTTVRLYNATRSILSTAATVGGGGSFTITSTASEGDLLFLYIGGRDVAPDATMNIVFSEPIAVGTIPTGADDPTRNQIINTYLHGVIKLEQVFDTGAVDISSNAVFRADSGNRRVLIDLPATFVRDGRYRITALASLTDPKNNRLAERRDKNGTVIGTPAADITFDFKVRPGPTSDHAFTLQPTATQTGGSLKDLARFGNLVFVAALDGGLLAYDISEPSMSNGTLPIAVVPTNWANSGVQVSDFWSVAADHHGRIYGGGFQASFSVVRGYRVEDFLAARDGQLNCPGGPHTNCISHGSAIVGWRPGVGVGMPLNAGWMVTNQPSAYPRKIKLLEQDDEQSATLDELKSNTGDGVEILDEVSAGNGYHRFTVRLTYAPSGESHLVQRVTVVNPALDFRWHGDAFKGETLDIPNVLARPEDRLTILRNLTTYGVVTLFGYGAAVYDLNAMETNDFKLRCTGTFLGQHGTACAAALTQRALPEKIVNTTGSNEGCNLEHDMSDDLTYSPEIFGIVRSVPTASGGVNVSPDIHIIGVRTKNGLIDVVSALPSEDDGGLTDGCESGANTVPVEDHPALSAIIQRVSTTQRQTGGALYRWGISSTQNVAGVRGSAPNTDVHRDYLLVAANKWGILVFEIGGTPPPAGPGYGTLGLESLVDVIWIAAGAAAVAPIEGTNLAAVIDLKGRLLILDLANIDERWGPATAANPSPLLPPGPFKIPTAAMNAAGGASGEIGVDDPRVVYKSANKFTSGTLPPIVDPDTGIAFGGDVLTQNMRVRAVLDPKIEFLIDAGNGLQPTNGITPLGVAKPSSASTTPAGALGAFRVRVTLPGSLAEVLADQKVHLAVESELVPGAVTPQSARSLPRAHLRVNDREGTVDPRKVTDFTLRRAIAFTPSMENTYRHQRGFNRLLSPWIVALADPRASERVTGDAAAKTADGCLECERPSGLKGKTEADGVYELYTAGRYISARLDSHQPGVLAVDDLPDFYKYLAEKSRLDVRIPTTIADTVRPKAALIPPQHAPLAQGTIDGTVFVHSGELGVDAADLYITGRGPADLMLTRSYRSRTIGGTPIGLGWDASFLRRIRPLPDGNVEYRDASGDIWLFKKPAQGPGAAPPAALQALEASVGVRFRYTAPPGLYVSLMRSDDGWTMLDDKWRITRFDNFGRITAETDEFWKAADVGAGAASGNQFRYLYDIEGRLAQIVDPIGRITTIRYWEKNPTGANVNCTNVGAKTNPCAYPGLMKEIVDWRRRSVLFEYDHVGRLIAVQLPNVKAIDGAPSSYDFSTPDKRPRIRYQYDSATAAYPGDTASPQEFTDFMHYAANLAEIVEPADESSGDARVRFEFFRTTDEKRDRLHFERWPCGSRAPGCTETEADFAYQGNILSIKDMLGQVWEYALTQDSEQRKHIQSVTAKDVPTFHVSASSTNIPLVLTATGADLVTKYENFSADGIPTRTTYPSGRVVDLTIAAPQSNPNAHCKQLQSVNDNGGGASRNTTITYETQQTALCTATALQRGNDKRETESPSRDRDKTTTVDETAGVSVETTYDSFGRPTIVTRKGSGTDSMKTVYTYKPNNSGDPIAWSRLADITGGNNDTYQNFTYTSDSVGGETVTVHDTKRKTTTTTRYDASGQPIYRKLDDDDFGILSEEKMAYDASGRLTWTSTTAPTGTFDTTVKYDPLGRVDTTTTTRNNVMGVDKDLEVRHTYDLAAKIVTTTDPAGPGGAPAAQQITTLDALGRPIRIEHRASSPPPGGGDTPTILQLLAYDKHGAVSYQSDTVRDASITSRDGLGRPAFTLRRDGLRTTFSWSDWDQPQQTTVTAGSATVSSTRQFFTDEGQLYATNESVDTRVRRTRRTWLAGGQQVLDRTGIGFGLNDDTAPGAARGTRTTTDLAGRVTDVVTGGLGAGDTDITKIYHHTNFADFRGDVATLVHEIEPMRNVTIDHRQTLDGLDRVRNAKISDHYETTTTYDVAGNLELVTPSGEGATRMFSDSRGLTYRTERPDAPDNVVLRFFDERGALRRITDETGDITNYITDDLGRVVRVDYPDTTHEETRYENKTGLVTATRDRAGQWLSYNFDDGGRVTHIRLGEDPNNGPVVTEIEYNDAKRIARVANKNGAVEYEAYDDLGRPTLTRTIRYANESGLKPAPDRIVSDSHTQTHAWSVFGSERSSWSLPVAGTSPAAQNGTSWRTAVIETRDAGGNLVLQQANGADIATAIPGGIGRVLEHDRALSTSGMLATSYGFTDASGSGPDPGDPAIAPSGMLSRSETKVGSRVLAGTQTFPDRSLRVRTAHDLALGRSSKWVYDGRGRLTSSKLLVPQEDLLTTPAIADVLSGSEFREERQTETIFGPLEHGRLGLARSLEVEPASWRADEDPGHQIDNRTMKLDGADVLQRDYAFADGRRSTDGVWQSTYDEFGRLTRIESSSRRIEYVYGPTDRIIGRNAYMVGGSGWTLETRSTVLAADALPAQTTFVWDPIVDRLVAIYDAGASTGATAAPDAGLLRQYVHGDAGYDDPGEVFVASTPGGTATRYLPVFDEAGTGSLQAVVDGDGHVVERVLFGDSYGAAPRFLHGPVVEKVTFTAKRDPAGTITEAEVRVRFSENVASSGLANAMRLRALDADGEQVALHGGAPEFPDPTSDDHHELRWRLTPGDWSALVNAAGAESIEVAVSSSLRTDAWGNTPVQEVPDWAHTLFGATSTTAYPVIVTALITTLTTPPAAGMPQPPLYEIKSLYMAASPTSRTHTLTGFKAAPFTDPATGLAFFRARWYDPETGTWLTPDPVGYDDSSNLYAFAGGDPVNSSDPTGLCLGFGQGTCADWANAGKKKLDAVRLFVDKHTGSTIFDVGVNAQLGFALDVVDTFVLDPLRFGEATGTAIGSGAGAVSTTLAVVQDVGRGAALAAGAGTVIRAAARFTVAVRSAVAFDSLGEAAARGLDEGAAIAARELAPDISAAAVQEQRVLANIAESAEARAASNFPTTAAAADELTGITNRAAKITDRLIKNNSTYWARVYNNPALRGQRFARAFARNPNFARSLIRGNIMDDVVKQLAQKSGKLPFMRITPRGARGADFINLFLNSAWDVTTAGSWARHVSRYAKEMYRLYPLIY
ncbi:MAG TPA: Ig-like domain-containing protein [Thermoanaerobaculia bacterium]